MIFHNPTMLFNFFIMFFRKKVKEAKKSKRIRENGQCVGWLSLEVEKKTEKPNSRVLNAKERRWSLPLPAFFSHMQGTKLTLTGQRI